jgi:hypothetical protein
MPGAEQVKDHVEPLLAVRVVDTANVDQAAKAAVRIIAKELQGGDELLAVDLDAKLAKRYPRGYKRRPEAICEISAELVRGIVHHSSRTWKGFSVRSCQFA